MSVLHYLCALVIQQNTGTMKYKIKLLTEEQYMKMLHWRERHIKEKHFILILAFVTGVGCAVAAYLQDRISFYGITDVVEKCMNAVDFIPDPDIDEIFATDRAAAARAEAMIFGKTS